jgi:hypothetical protein
VLLGVTLAFLVAEFGDKTMLATITLASTQPAVPTWIGASLGMTVASAFDPWRRHGPAAQGLDQPRHRGRPAGDLRRDRRPAKHPVIDGSGTVQQPVRGGPERLELGARSGWT